MKPSLTQITNMRADNTFSLLYVLAPGVITIISFLDTAVYNSPINDVKFETSLERRGFGGLYSRAQYHLGYAVGGVASHRQFLVRETSAVQRILCNSFRPKIFGRSRVFFFFFTTFRSFPICFHHPYLLSPSVPAPSSLSVPGAHNYAFRVWNS